MRRWMARSAVVVGLGCLMTFVFAPTAGAAIGVPPGPVTLTKSASGLTGTVNIANTSSNAVKVTATASGGGSQSLCTVTPDPSIVAPSGTRPVTLRLGKGCAEAGTDLNLTLVFDGALPGVVVQTAVATPGPAPDWGSLGYFGGALAGAALIVVLGYLVAGSTFAALSQPAEGLDASWSFQDSWVANINVGVALVTAIFASSEVLTDVLATDPTSELAVMLVAGAFATGLAAVGVLLTKSFAVKGKPYSWVVLAAAIPTLAGALGEILVVADQADTLKLGSLHDLILPIELGAIAVVALYGVLATRQFLKKHAVAEPTPVLSERLVAGALAAMGPQLSLAPKRLGILARQAAHVSQYPLSVTEEALAQEPTGVFEVSEAALSPVVPADLLEAEPLPVEVPTRRIRSAAMF
jgi:hypothetical protein